MLITQIRHSDPSHPYWCAVNTHSLEKDPNLDWKAKGLLMYLLTRPNGWEYREQDLVNKSSDGRISVQNGLRDLREARYIRTEQTRHPDGKMGTSTLWVSGCPMPKEDTDSGNTASGQNTPQTGSPTTGSPLSGRTRGAVKLKSSPKNQEDIQENITASLETRIAVPKAGYLKALEKQTTSNKSIVYSNNTNTVLGAPIPVSACAIIKSKRTKFPDKFNSFPAVFQKNVTFKEAWEAFLKYRRELGAALTESQKDRLAGQLVRQSPEMATARLFWAIDQGLRSPYPANGNTPFDTSETRKSYHKEVPASKLPTTHPDVVELFQDYFGGDSRINGQAYALAQNVNQIVLWYRDLLKSIELPEHKHLFKHEYPDVHSFCEEYLEWLTKQKWLTSKSVAHASPESKLFIQFLQYQTKRFNFDFRTGDRTN